MRILMLCCLILAFAHEAKSQPSPSSDSILNTLVELPDSTQIDSIRILALMRLKNEPQVAMDLLLRAEKLALKNNDSLSWACCMAMHGFATPDAETMAALDHYEKAIPILVREGHRFQIQALGNAADILVILGDYDQAITYQTLALEYVKSVGNKRHIIAITTNLGYFYDRMHDYAKAEELQRQALSVAQEEQDTFMLGLIYMRIAAAKDLAGSGDLDSAMHYYKVSRNLFELINEERRAAQVLGNIGNVFRLQGQTDSALLALQTAAAINKRLGVRHPYTINVINIGKVYFDQGDYDIAIDTLQSGLRWARKVADRNFELDALEFLYKAHEGKKDFEPAIEYLNRYARVNDSVFDAEKARQVANLQTRYETADKEREIALLNAEKTRAELEANAQRSRVFGIAGLALIILISSGFIVYGIRQRQRAQLAKREVEFQESLLSTQMMSQEEERKRIAKELHDGIAQTLASVKLQFQAFMRKEGIVEDSSVALKNSLTSLDDASNEVRTISHQIMPRALMDDGIISALNDMLQRSLGASGIEYRFDHQGVTDRSLAPHLEVALYRIAQELIQNVVKHSEASQVSILVYRVSEQAMLMVEDNGKGFNHESVHEGIGLKNIQSRVNTVHGNVTYESSETNGTLVTVSVPLATESKKEADS